MWHISRLQTTTENHKGRIIKGTGYFSSRSAAGRVGAACSRVRTTRANRTDTDLFPLESFDVFYFRLPIQPVHGPVKTNENKSKWSASGNGANDAGAPRDEVDVSPKQRHICHRRRHENQFHIQIFLSEVAFLLSDNHWQHGLAESRLRGRDFSPCTKWYGAPPAGAWPKSVARSTPRKRTSPAALSL